MALNSYTYLNNPNSTVLIPLSHVLNLGAQPLLYNVNGPTTSGAFPCAHAKSVYANIFICAETWGTAKVSIEVSPDGVNCWTPLFESTGNTPLTDIAANIYIPIVIRNVYVRAVLTDTGTNVSAILC